MAIVETPTEHATCSHGKASYERNIFKPFYKRFVYSFGATLSVFTATAVIPGRAKCRRQYYAFF